MPDLDTRYIYSTLRWSNRCTCNIGYRPDNHKMVMVVDWWVVDWSAVGLLEVD
ncbi:MAG: hypothetical protein JZD41_02400 [Thermoproteus sp.]|nr:hypothetical protein [Thermoproteus sp.]